MEYLTGLIAILALYIAYQQWKTNQIRLIHELFDRRFKIYKTTQTHLSYIQAHAQVDNENFPQLIQAAQDSTFLISDNMSEYLFEVVQKSNRLNTVKRRLAHAQDEQQRNHLIEQEDELLGWLSDQLPQLKDRFRPYLKLGK